jgi:hypothetical protein
MASKIYTKTVIITIFEELYEDLSSEINVYLMDDGDIVFMKLLCKDEDCEKWLVAIKKDWDEET